MSLTDEGIIQVPGMSSCYVGLGSGATAHYMMSGDSGPAVILLHGGITGSSGLAGWQRMAPFLGQGGFRVFCPDMPAFGLTDDPNGWYDYVGGHIDFIHDFAAALRLDRFHIAGNSMGCLNTVHYVLAHPERILSFAMIAGSVGDLVPSPSASPTADGAVTSTPRTNVFDGSERSMREMMEYIIYRKDSISDELVEMRTIAANRNREAYVGHWPRMVSMVTGVGLTPDEDARLRTRGRLDQLTLPAIYLFGLDDVLRPVEYAHRQEDALPGVQFFYPADCGHQGQTDQPDLFNQVFLEFFRDGRVTWETAQRAGVSVRRPPNPAIVATPH